VYVDSAVELYDSDRLAVGRVVNKLAEKQGTMQDPREFATEIVERFAEAGLQVDVAVATVNPGEHDEHYGFAVQISGRLDPEAEFDHERMSHEVRGDVLGRLGGRVGSTPVAMPGAGTLWTPR
jgi:hypothetical protein